MGKQPSDPDLNLGNNYGYYNYRDLPPSVSGAGSKPDNYSHTDISAPTVTNDNPNYIDPKHQADMPPQIRNMLHREEPDLFRAKVTSTNPNYLDPKQMASTWNDEYPNIRTLIAWARLEHDGRLYGMAHLWDQFVTHLQNLQTTVGNATDRLAVGPDGKGGWPPSKSEASRSFLQNVGKATYSISDWITFGQQNAQSFRDVAKQVATSRKNMEDIYRNFVRDYNSAIDQLNSDDKKAKDSSNDSGLSKAGQWFVSGETDGQYYADQAKQDRKDKDEVMKKYTRQAQGEMKKLADVYASSYFALNEGTTYKGPLKSQNPLDAYVQRVKGLAGGANPALGGAAQQAAAAQRQMAAQRQAMQQKFAAQQKQLKEQLQKKQDQLIANRKKQLEQQEKLQKDRLAAEQRRLEQQQNALQQQIANQSAQFNAQRTALGPQANRFNAERSAMRQRTNNLGNEVSNGASRVEAEQNAMRQRMNGVNENGLRQTGGGTPGRGGMMRPPQLGRPAGNSGLRGRAGGPPGEEKTPGRSPLGGRGDRRKGERPGAKKGTDAARPESEEYLGEGVPTAPERLAGRLDGQQTGPAEITPPRAGLPGRGGPGGRGPNMPGAPRGRQLTPKDLNGRRQRMSDAKAEEDELFTPLSFARPDLTGRNGLPEIDWERVDHGEIGVDPELTGARGAAAKAAPQPGMAERLIGRSQRKDDKRKDKAAGESDQAASEASEELWTVETPESIDTPAEQKVDERRGRVLGSGG